MKSFNRYLLVVVVVLSQGFQELSARGLDNLKPPQPVVNRPSSLPSNQGAGNAATSVSNDAIPKSTLSENGAAPITGAAASSVSAQAQVLEPSAISKRLANKFSLDFTAGFMTFSASKATWSSRAGAGLGANYWVYDFANYKLYAGFAYAAADVVAEVKNSDSKLSYRGVVQSYAVTTLMKRELKENILVGVGIAAKILVPSMHALDQNDTSPIDSSLKTTQFNASIGGGVEWRLANNFYLGPYLGVGFGGFTTSELVAKSVYIF